MFPQFVFIDHADRPLEDLKVAHQNIKTDWYDHGRFETTHGGVTTSYSNTSRVYKHSRRHVGDRLTLTISLDTSKVTPPKTPDREEREIRCEVCQVYERDYFSKDNNMCWTGI